MNNLYGILISLLYIVLVIACSKLFEKAGKEASRKFIHIMLANWWIIAMIFFDNVVVASILPAVFVVINYLSYKYNLISVMERDGEEEKTLGTVYYAISLLLIAIFTFGVIYNPLIGLVGILVMGYGDGFAAIAGKAISSKEYNIFGNKKSVAGSVIMFIISLIIISGALAYLGEEYWLFKSIIIAILSTMIEAVSFKGTDNLFVPIFTSLMVWMVI